MIDILRDHMEQIINDIVVKDSDKCTDITTFVKDTKGRMWKVVLSLCINKIGVDKDDN